MYRGDGHGFRHRATHFARELGYGIDRLLADREHGRSTSIAPRQPDGSRPMLWNFNSNGS